jgi:hypothetical protein
MGVGHVPFRSFVKSPKVLTFCDVSIEEIAHSNFEIPEPS